MCLYLQCCMVIFHQFLSSVPIMPPMNMQVTKLQCATCKKFVAASYMYQHHYRNHDGAKKIHICTKCGKQYPEKKRLENHRLRLHPEKDLGVKGDASPEPVRTLMCDVCDKMFFTEDDLKQHMMRQHREDPIKYACLTCGKTFKNNSLFGQHMSKSHKNIICGECPTNAGKKFGSKSALKKHTLNKHPKDTS